MVRRIAKSIFPARSLRRRIAVRFVRKLHILPPPPPDNYYAEWIERSEPFLWTDPDSVEITFKPLISIVVPVFNSPAKYLLPMVYSVVNQELYENWELVLVNASTTEKAIALTKECQQIDSRIKVFDVENKGIAQNTNEGLRQCSGEYVALLDHDDLLAPRALYEVSVALQGPERPQLIYSDEDKITENGKYRFDVHFKPDWSPQLFRQVNYLNHLMVIEKKIINEVGGYKKNYEGAQDYDLFLRIIDKKARIKHIPKVLYHWRAAHTSTANDFSTKSYLLRAGEKALDDHLKRNRQNGKALAIKEQPGFYNIIFEPASSDRAAILLVPTKNSKQYTYFARHIIGSLQNSKIKADVFIGDTVEDVRQSINDIKIHQIDASSSNDFFARSLEKTKANLLIIFNAAAVPTDKHWVENLAGVVSQVSTIGVVAPMLVQPKPNNEVFDAGFVKHGGTDIALFRGMKFDKHTYFGNTLWNRNVDYLSGRVLAMRRNIFEKYFQPMHYEPSQKFIKAPYDQMAEDSLEVVTFSQVKMEYRGEPYPAQYDSRFYSKNLAIKSYGIGLPKNMNLPPGVNNEE